MKTKEIGECSDEDITRFGVDRGSDMHFPCGPVNYTLASHFASKSCVLLYWHRY